MTILWVPDESSLSNSNFKAKSENNIINYEINFKHERNIEDMINKTSGSIQKDKENYKTSLHCTKPNCHFLAKTPRSLTKHLTGHKDCPYCEKTFSGQNATKYFETHIKRHQKLKLKTVCDFCGKDFKFVSLLARHKPKCLKKQNLSGKIQISGISKIQDNEEIEPIKIEDSENSSSIMRIPDIQENKEMDETRETFKTEEGETPEILLKCPKSKCSFQTINQQEFSTHLMSHKDCPHCEEIFHGPHSLQDFKQHMKQHQKCRICDKYFNNLKQHNLETHAEELKCKFCGKEFNFLKSLMHHMEKHFKCKHCDKNFEDSTLLHYHMKLKHGDEDEMHYKGDPCGKITTLEN